MRLNKDFAVSTISGKSYLVPICGEVSAGRSMLRLNESGLFIVNCLKETECSRQELLIRMRSEYEVEEEVLCQALDEFLVRGKQAGFII